MTTSEILVEQMTTSLFRTNAAHPLNHVAKEVRQCDHNANLVGKIEVYVKDSVQQKEKYISIRNELRTLNTVKLAAQMSVPFAQRDEF